MTPVPRSASARRPAAAASIPPGAAPATAPPDPAERLLRRLGSAGLETEAGRRFLRERCLTDIHLFARYFFADHLRLPCSRMHRDLFRQYRAALHPGPLETRPPLRTATAAPRGSAKSTLRSLIFPIHAVVYGLERYILILSATFRQASQRLRNIRHEIRHNPRLRAAFAAEIDAPGESSARSLRVNGVQIDVFSAGTEIRGISHGAWRPTLLVLDDIEDSASARSPLRREKKLEWFNEVVENIGDSCTAVHAVGTVLHPDSLLAGLLQRPDFDAQKYCSVLSFAEADDLWDEWRRRFADLDDPDRTATARRFFEERRDEMLRGACVLWPAREDYYDLMVQLATRGRAAFLKEKQNEPLPPGTAFFNAAAAIRFHLERH